MISEKVDDDDNGFWLVGLKISNSRIYYEYSLHESLTFFFCFSTCLRGKKKISEKLIYLKKKERCKIEGFGGEGMMS